MNKASFLTLVRQASRISDQDVEELEKLVVNFPYCQTAHLLIAKAAYDQGSMLSNQKLKKAAIYAANRQLLKKLIYTSDATVALQPLEIQEMVAETPEKVIPPSNIAVTPYTIPEVEILEETETHQVDLDADVSDHALQILQETAKAEAASEIPLVTPETDSVKDETAATIPQEIPELIAGSETDEQGQPATELAEATSHFTNNIPDELQKTHPESNPEEASTGEVISATSEANIYPDASLHAQIPASTNIEPLPVATHASEESSETEETDQAESSKFVAEIPEETVGENPEKVIVSETEPLIEPEPSTSENLAQTVSDSEEKGRLLVASAAHALEDVTDLHELFLENAPEALLDEAEEKPETADKSTFLHDELLHETLANFDQYLFRPEKASDEELVPEPDEDLKVTYPEAEVQHIYDKDPLGYWMNSSRMGESLQLKNDLTTPQPYDFYPELIYEYSKTHELRKEIKPQVSKLDKQLEIIDEFLKITPRLKAMAHNKVKPETQEDLSSKSSRIPKNLASENFANILVQQGKIKKAIKIYEHLILKIPEKKPYFVAQIEKLQNQA